MADQLQANDQANGAEAESQLPSKTDNWDAWANYIGATFEDIYTLEGEIAAAVAEHVQPLRARRKKLRQGLRAKTGITQEVIDWHYNGFAIAKQKAAIEDEEKREKALQDMAEMHAVLHPGQTVNWLDVIERIDAIEIEDEHAAAAE